MKYDPEQHHRRSIRLKGYDYTRAGAYFVTICVQEKKCLFGEVRNGIMYPNQYGRILHEIWNGLPRHYPFVELDRFLLMPNHVHMILVLKPHAAVGAGLKPARTLIPRVSLETESSEAIHPIITQWHDLSEIIRGFKTFSSRQINALRNSPGTTVWQRNYYEHIIRNWEDWGRVREYIRTNPANWDKDEENPLHKADESKRPHAD